MGHPLIWLDNTATTQKPCQVIEATSAFYNRDNSNIRRATYALAERSPKLFKAGREKVRQFSVRGMRRRSFFCAAQSRRSIW